MRDLPQGTVTFLFTDIEGSTRLLREHGEGYVDMLSEHRRALREAFVRHGGVEVDTEGDAFFVAFARASDAIAAASEGQAALRDGPIRVRMGLHTGEPIVADDNYVGMDIHRAARIAASGHGGQVVLSQTTRDLVAGEAVRDLGEHRLKDLSAPERLFQLGDGDFPRLKTLYRTNLPVPATPFLGRERELEDVVALLRREDLRLLTLTGPGGTGKTRLALQAAAEIAEDVPDGVWWVSLAPLRDPALALDAVARALDVQERPGSALEETLLDVLAVKRVLLLIDNVEHLLPGVASVIARLRESHRAKLLVTSRERLQLQGEQAWPVPSLDDRDGAALFTARARALRPGFTETPAVTELCARLDNLPLALELAAARVPIFPPEQLLERLGKGLQLKGGRDADPRQQTLSATIRWSYDLLAPEERGLFVRLAVFTGGCTYDAAEAVCEADVDTLQSLIDKSLVRSREVTGGSRFWMLETIREFAAAELASSGEADALRQRHAGFFTEFVESADPYVRHGPDQRQWIERAALDYDNVRSAMSYALEHDLTLALRLVGRLTFVLWTQGGFSEAKTWLDAILSSATDQPLGLLGRAHECGATIAERTRDVAGQARHSEAAYAAFAAIGDEQGMVDALRERGRTAWASGNTLQATALFTEMSELAERIGDRWNAAIALNNLGSAASQAEEWERSVDLCGRSSALRRELGDEWGMALALCNVAWGELKLGRLSAAARNQRVAIEASMNVRANTVLEMGFEMAIHIATALGKTREAACLAGATSRLHEELGSGRHPEDQLEFEQAIEALRAALGAEADAEIRRGHDLTLEEAVAVALAALSDPD